MFPLSAKLIQNSSFNYLTLPHCGRLYPANALLVIHVSSTSQYTWIASKFKDLFLSKSPFSQVPSLNELSGLHQLL